MPRSAPSNVADTRPDADGVAITREHFLTEEDAATERVRATILASWQRSRELKVAPDRIELPYLRDPDSDTRLTRSAEPVLRRLGEQLKGQPVSIILTDPSGLVLSRRTGDHDLERYLDRVKLAPGFSYAEEFVGTNGIGTALEAGRPTEVFGHEHYAEHLETLACAGVPIQDPISGRTVGAVDLTCWRKDAESLLLTVAQSAAEQIGQALLADAGMQELQVFQAYRRTCRRMSGIVFALTNDAVMLNDQARSLLQPGEQSALLAYAGHTAEDLAPGKHRSLAVTLPTGTAARMYCEQVGSGDTSAGLVVHVKLGAAAPSSGVVRSSSPNAMALPGLVGDAASWLHACQDVEGAYRGNEWLAVEGEPGVGKLAVLRAVQLRRQPATRFTVLDAGHAAENLRWLDVVREALASSDSVVIRHVHTLDAANARELSLLLQEVRRPDRAPAPWVAVTLTSAPPRGEFEPVLRLFPRTVELPPLRLRMEDLPALTAFFLAKLGHGGKITCSPDTMRVLMRAAWPGNVAQLQLLLHQVVQHRRSGAIQPQDLPPEVQTISRRVLNPLEAMERDAIVRSLADAGGNKATAARALGVSRATIYRKIHEYGIVASG
jgi:transcriptional regulator of acetoin/glycerol metabolism